MLGGEAVTLWRITRATGDVHCFVVDEMPGGFWLGVEDRDKLVVSETLPRIEDVMDRAEELRLEVMANEGLGSS